MEIHVVNNLKHVTEVRNALKESGGYCPCKLEKTEDTKCICKEFRESPAGTTCHCGLYIKTKE